MTPPTVEQTRHLIRLLHNGQTDKAGKPYHEHPERVAALLGDDATDDERIVALLHDVIEDTWISPRELRLFGYSERVRSAVQSLTRKGLFGTHYMRGMSYEQWIDQLVATKNTLVFKVKIADLRDNLDPERLALLPEETQASLRKRYERALETLTAAMPRGE